MLGHFRGPQSYEEHRPLQWSIQFGYTLGNLRLLGTDDKTVGVKECLYRLAQTQELANVGEVASASRFLFLDERHQPL